MIIPTQITNFNRTNRELQIFWMFCIFVAGRNSDFAASKVSQIMAKIPENKLPFDEIAQIDIRNMLVANKVGQYNRIAKALEQSFKLNLTTATLDDLLNIFGVGPKTARFFLLHTRKNCECAVLDTHILKWMRLKGFHMVPDTTPQKAEDYKYWERIFISRAKACYPNLSIAEADLLIWSQMSGRLEQ